MNFNNIPCGTAPPDNINVVIEIPSQSEPVKYEIDKDTGVMTVDRFMSTSMFYPLDYGFIPQTLGEDGDPIDVLVLSPVPLLRGAMICCRPIGLLQMKDEAGRDTKLLTVPISKLSTRYASYHSPQDVPADILAAVKHFFEHYKDLEPGKWVEVGQWLGAEEAKAEVMQGVERYQSNHP